MREYGSLPRARQGGLIEEVVGGELLLYDRDSHTAHCLSPVAACVWRRCDGEHDLAELAVLAGVSEGLVAEALHELREKDLLVAEPLTPDTVPGESRREAIVRVARYGAAAATGSMIVSATVATPAMASSEEAVGCCQCYTSNGAECLCAETTSAQCPNFCTTEKLPRSTWSAKSTGLKCNAAKTKCE